MGVRVGVSVGSVSVCELGYGEGVWVCWCVDVANGGMVKRSGCECRMTVCVMWGMVSECGCD